MLGKARSVREFLTSEPRQAGARVENAPKFLFILGGSIVHPKMAQRRQSKGNSSRTCFQTTSTNCIFLSSEGNVPGGNTAPKQWVRVYHANRTSKFVVHCGAACNPQGHKANTVTGHVHRRGGWEENKFHADSCASSAGTVSYTHLTLPTKA